MSKVGRNDPCPCGSGDKYKRCHLGKESPLPRTGRGASFAALEPSPGLPPKVLAHLQALEKKRREEVKKFGRVRPVVHGRMEGYAFVGVGSEIHYDRGWKTFPDFLFSYIKTVFARIVGREWGNGELKRPFDQRHPILQWYQLTCEFQAKHVPGPDGIKEAVPDGPTLAYLMLAYDLYVIAHHVGLQESLVKRLSHKDQFQGARYELAVAATLVRAGCKVAYEDERDPSKKHVEFIATHEATGQQFAVEAKSRHRPGILGHPGTPATKEEFRLGIEDLFKKALAKTPEMPFVIFIDANMPPDVAWEKQKEWTEEVDRMLLRVASGWGDLGVFEPVIHNALLVTNFVDHYGEPGGRYPGRIGYLSVPNPVRYPMKVPHVIEELVKATEQYGSVPQRLGD